MENTNPTCGHSGGDFLLGVGTAGVVAVILNAAKDKSHQEELQQVYWQGIRQGRGQMTEIVSAKDTQLYRLAELLKQRDAEIGRLNTIVENQAKALAKVPIAWTLPLPLSPHTEDDNGNGKHIN